MSYSRRELYALGEPLGDSATYRKADGGLVLGGGGSGGGSGSGTQTQISELPSWARPYAQRALEKGEALSEQEYKPYSADRIAGFSPMQLQSQEGAANMQTNAGLGAGMGIAGSAALGALNSKYKTGRFNAGQFDSDAAQQYMNPYMQNAVDVQKREATRQADIMGQKQQAAATGQGAFGGSREALMRSEANRNLGQQLNDIQAIGSSNAYNNAQQQFNADQARSMQAQQLGEQSRQYGAGYGMQGLQTALQGAGQLGQLGQTQFQQGMDINKLQNAYGGQQQALRQQGLSQAYQDFQDEKNYPYKQLGFMADMIRGLPLGQQSTRQVYEAPGSMSGQLAGLGMGAYGLSKLSNFFAEGGMTYADGGSVESTGSIESIVSKLSDAQLEQAMKAAQARGDASQMQIIEAEVAMRASERNGMAGAYNSLPQETQEGMAEMAGGGVVAFADTGLVTDPMGNVSGSDYSGTPDDRTIFERLGVFNPENRRALEAGKRDAARTSDPNSPYSAKSANLLDADEAAAYAETAGKNKKAEAQSLGGKGSGSIVNQAKAAAVAAGIPAEDFESQMRRLRKEFQGEDDGYKKEMLDQYKKATARLEESKSKAGYEALAQFGFNMAAQAAKPGQARRKGLLGALESAGAASPILIQSLTESNKLNRAAEDNLDKMRTDQLRFEQSLTRNDRQSAMQFANAISQDKKTQAMLDIERQKLGILGQQAANTSSTALQKIADDLQRSDPNLDRRAALGEASKIAGYSYRQEAANQGKLAETIRKIDEKFNMLDMLPPDSEMARQMRTNRDRQISEAKRQFGGDMGMQAGAGSNSILKFDSKGNLIQ
jgi:hypothetical protein